MRKLADFTLQADGAFHCQISYSSTCSAWMTCPRVLGKQHPGGNRELTQQAGAEPSNTRITNTGLKSRIF